MAYNYNIQTDITRALSKYNRLMTGPRFNTLDGNILNLVKSFTEADTKFYMSNKELAEIMIADPSTIQRSIDRLLAAALISKEIIYIAAKPQRLLTYNKQAVQNIIDLYWIAHSIAYSIAICTSIIIIYNNKIYTRNTTYYSY